MSGMAFSVIRLSWDLPRGGTFRTSAGHHRQLKRSGALQDRAPLRFNCRDSYGIKSADQRNSQQPYGSPHLHR